MRQIQYIMKPQDIVILLKMIASGNEHTRQINLAESLHMSQSEISQSIVRSKYAGLLDESGKKVMRASLMDFLQYGLPFVFPQKPGPIVRGIPTAHSGPPLKNEIASEEMYVWPHATGTARGHSILPLYPSAVEAAKKDEKLYEL